MCAQEADETELALQRSFKGLAGEYRLKKKKAEAKERGDKFANAIR